MPWIPQTQLTRMVVTMSVRLARESVILLDLSLLPSVMLSPLLEFQIPIYTEHIRGCWTVSDGAYAKESSLLHQEWAQKLVVWEEDTRAPLQGKLLHVGK